MAEAAGSGVTRETGEAGPLVSTIGSIALEAGVSVPTVSKVLNGRADVAPATRARVEEVLGRQQYRRRRQVSKEMTSPLLDLVFNDLGSPWATEIVKGVQKVAEEYEVDVVLAELHGRHAPERGWLSRVVARRPRGVILVLSTPTAAQRSALASRGIPFVVVDTDGVTPEDVPTVGSNNWFGGLSATRHLLQLGHRRIGVLSGPDDVLCSRARVDGWRSAHAEAGVPAAEDLVRYGEFRVSSGLAEGLQMLSRPDRPTAVFACSDMQALGVFRAAHEIGLNVPGDLAVVGYDDIPIGQWSIPALTTVHQPMSEMGAAAARIVLDASHYTGDRPPRVELSTHLVVRESTAPPATTGSDDR
jgi:DNA-binding LacI/PurR family transcriptional regulator